MPMYDEWKLLECVSRHGSPTSLSKLPFKCNNLNKTSQLIPAYINLLMMRKKKKSELIGRSQHCKVIGAIMGTVRWSKETGEDACRDRPQRIPPSC